tara:strand:- start:8055 stop:10625 length:2571 start_codon:yes stop_codon:yes gene_type:complete
MNEFLIQHAIRNVWCSPDQDHQYLFQPMRLTRDNGVRRYVDVEWDRHWLPDPDAHYHVYQIGQLSPIILNLILTRHEWYTFSSAMNTNNITLDAYTPKGLQMPRFECYFMKTETRNLIIAVKDQPRIDDLGKTPLFVRFYSNAFFGSERSHPTNDRVYTDGIVASDRKSVVVFKAKVEKLINDWTGDVYQFHNGVLVDTLRPDEIRPGDKIEFVQDTSIYEIFDAPVEELPTFNSRLDNKRKYFVSRPKGSTDTIDFHDDIDIWLVREVDNREEGLFYHKGAPDAVRMVTHKDISLPVSSIVEQVRKNTGWGNVKDVTLRLRIRRSGYHRPLVKEHNRIHELYQLETEEAIVGAIVGANANVREWQAANLEESCYTAIMRHKGEMLKSNLVQCAYGYDGIAYLIANTPQKPVTLPSGNKGIKPPWRLRFDSTFFEYDKKGRLIDGYYHDQARTYQNRHEHTGYVEALVGQGDINTGTEYARYSTPISREMTHRAYICDIVGGVPTYDWCLAEKNVHYTTTDDELVWLVEADEYFTAVRDDTNFLFYSFDAHPHNGMIAFTIESEDLLGELRKRRPCFLPYGQLDVFLNGHSLIENLDYFVKWPEVVICNKEYLREDGGNQRISVRAHGFLSYTCDRIPPAEYGFVKRGLLSVNQRYDVREGKVLRMVADGRLWTRDELKFAESDWGVRMDKVRNGAPYLIQDLLVPMKGLADTDAYTFREASLDVDRRIGDYLSLYRPEPEVDEVDLIPRRYRVLSPFVSRVHHDLQSGYLYPTDITGQYSDEKIKEWLKDYEWLLEYDPLIQGVDLNYVAIHPHEFFHETVLDLYQYNFLARVIKVYLQGKVSLSTHVRIQECRK